jgi:hypothetical protein
VSREIGQARSGAGRRASRGPTPPPPRLQVRTILGCGMAWREGGEGHVGAGGRARGKCGEVGAEEGGGSRRLACRARPRVPPAAAAAGRRAPWQRGAGGRARQGGGWARGRRLAARRRWRGSWGVSALSFRGRPPAAGRPAHAGARRLRAWPTPWGTQCGGAGRTNLLGRERGRTRSGRTGCAVEAAASPDATSAPKTHLLPFLKHPRPPAAPTASLPVCTHTPCTCQLRLPARVPSAPRQAAYTLCPAPRAVCVRPWAASASARPAFASPAPARGRVSGASLITHQRSARRRRRRRPLAAAFAVATCAAAPPGRRRPVQCPPPTRCRSTSSCTPPCWPACSRALRLCTPCCSPTCACRRRSSTRARRPRPRRRRGQPRPNQPAARPPP